MKTLSIAILTVLSSALALAPAGAAVLDPERESSLPTAWHWEASRNATQLDTLRARGERIVDLEPSPTTANTFDAVLVSNSGDYHRTDAWQPNLTAAGVETYRTRGYRAIDLEPFTSPTGERRFAATFVRNTGDAQKTWDWGYDLTGAQVSAAITRLRLRIIDLDAYTVDGALRYSYVGIANTGVDAKGWWWWYNVSAAFLDQQIRQLGGRLIDIERQDNGNYSAVMIEGDGPGWWWGYNATQQWMEDLLELTSSRLISLESYTVGSERRYAFVAVDNANPETQRLRGLIDQTYDNPAFGNAVKRGFVVKEVGGPTHAALAANLSFQPLSTLKLLPYLHAWIEIDHGNASLGGPLFWVEAKSDDPATPWDERKYQSCLAPGPTTQLGAAPFADALPTMMWESHGRTLDSFLSLYGPDNITNRAHQLGLTHTEMHFGCAQPGDPVPWAKNRTTLYDLAELFRGVEQLDFVSQPATRDAFFANMINLDYDGAAYTSPITGATTGPYNIQALREIVKREAGPAKQADVEPFLQGIIERGKGGSGGPSSAEFGFSDFLHVTLPVYQGGQIVPKTYSVGWFVYGLSEPPGCPESMAWDNGPCQAIWTPEYAALDTFRLELLAEPIRQALATWP